MSTTITYPTEIRTCRACQKQFTVPIISKRQFCPGGRCKTNHWARKERQKVQQAAIETWQSQTAYTPRQAQPAVAEPDVALSLDEEIALLEAKLAAESQP